MNPEDTYLINLVSLKEGITEFGYKIGNGFFSPEETERVLGADVDVRLDINKRHESYRLEFTFDGKLDAMCDRCLDAVRLDIAAEWSLTVRHGDDYDTAETGSGEEMMVIPEDCTSIDVAPMIRDTLLLSIPLRCVHADGECNKDMSAKLREHSTRETEDPDS